MEPKSKAFLKLITEQLIKLTHEIFRNVIMIDKRTSQSIWHPTILFNNLMKKEDTKFYGGTVEGIMGLCIKYLLWVSEGIGGYRKLRSNVYVYGFEMGIGN